MAEFSGSVDDGLEAAAPNGFALLGASRCPGLIGLPARAGELVEAVLRSLSREREEGPKNDDGGGVRLELVTERRSVELGLANLVGERDAPGVSGFVLGLDSTEFRDDGDGVRLELVTERRSVELGLANLVGERDMPGVLGFVLGLDRREFRVDSKNDRACAVVVCAGDRFVRECRSA